MSENNGNENQLEQVERIVFQANDASIKGTEAGVKLAEKITNAVYASQIDPQALLDTSNSEGATDIVNNFVQDTLDQSYLGVENYVPETAPFDASEHPVLNNMYKGFRKDRFMLATKADMLAGTNLSDKFISVGDAAKAAKLGLLNTATGAGAEGVSVDVNAPKVQMALKINGIGKGFRVVGKVFKFAQKTNKIVGKVARYANATKLTNSQGKFDPKAIEKQTKMIMKDTTKLATKPVKKGVKYVAKRVTKPIRKAIQKLVRKIVKKVVKTIIKIIKKIAQKVKELIQKLIDFIIDFWWVILIIIAVILVLALVILTFYCMISPFLPDEDLERYNDVIAYVDDDLQDKLTEIYDEGYRLDGAYEISNSYVSYIDWYAALATMNGLDPDMCGCDAELWLLMNQWGGVSGASTWAESIGFNLNYNVPDDNMFYTLSQEETEEYVLQEAETEECETCDGEGTIIVDLDGTTETCDDCEGTGEIIIKEEVTTTIMYVLTIHTLKDYEEWVDNNTDVLEKFYKKKYNDLKENLLDKALNLGYKFFTGTDRETVSSTFTETYPTQQDYLDTKKLTDDGSYLTDEIKNQIESLYAEADFSLFTFTVNSTVTRVSATNNIILNTGDTNGILKYPTSYHTITTSYGYYSSGEPHTGADFACPVGTEVCAAYEGTVVTVNKWNYSYGYHVIIEHSIEVDGEVETIYTVYAHLSQIFVSEGDTVSQGELIAYSGSTGNSTGPHLHFEVRVGQNHADYAVDPAEWLE